MVEGNRAVVGVSAGSGIDVCERVATLGELRAAKRRDRSSPESGTGMIGVGIGVSVCLDGGLQCGYPQYLR